MGDIDEFANSVQVFLLKMELMIRERDKTIANLEAQKLLLEKKVEQLQQDIGDFYKER